MYAAFGINMVSIYDSPIFFSLSKDLLSTCSLIGQTNLNLIADDLFSQTAFWFGFAISLRVIFFIQGILYYSRRHRTTRMKVLVRERPSPAPV